MFYERQPKEQQENYKDMLAKVGSLSNLFSESDCPYLSYRAHENIFCKYFKAENLARTDCSADAKKNTIGIGLKTWTGNDDQKVAEFGRLKSQYAGLTGIELVKKIAEFRNERIRITKNMHGLDTMLYHVVRRVPGTMQILECNFDPIDINNIEIIPEKGNVNNTYFTDGKHEYHFSVSKNTLYMIFSDLKQLDSVEVEMLADPYAYLTALLRGTTMKPSYIMREEVSEWDSQSGESHYGEKLSNSKENQLCLPLYAVSTNGNKFVAERSGLNQWNAKGRVRDENEVYIQYNKRDRERSLNFFPPRDTSFTLHLPDGTEISAKVCQEADSNNPAIGKAIMSNPNKVLGKWLLRDVLEIPPKQLLTYEMLQRYGIDCVIFTKNKELDYSIDFGELGTYEAFYGLKDKDADIEFED